MKTTHPRLPVRHFAQRNPALARLGRSAARRAKKTRAYKRTQRTVKNKTGKLTRRARRAAEGTAATLATAAAYASRIGAEAEQLARSSEEALTILGRPRNLWQTVEEFAGPNLKEGADIFYDSVQVLGPDALEAAADAAPFLLL